MAIQWYPGHMHKASKEMKQVMPQVDLIIEVLDARIPFSSQNPMLNEIRGDKPCIKLLNKVDLADQTFTESWQTYLEQQKSVKTLAISASLELDIKALIKLCKQMVPTKANSIKQIQAMIMGIPNVGKSTLINRLAGRQIAKTGNEPAVTKTQQRIKLDEGIVLHDTPGVLWPNLENPHSGYRLAITGAIKETAIENDDIGLYAIEYLIEAYPHRIKERYKLETLSTPMETLELIAQKRGCIRSGGRPDIERTAKILLTELRSGLLGNVSWETPSVTEKEWLDVLKIREEKAAKKAARNQKRKGSR